MPPKGGSRWALEGDADLLCLIRKARRDLLAALKELEVVDNGDTGKEGLGLDQHLSALKPFEETKKIIDGALEGALQDLDDAVDALLALSRSCSPSWSWRVEEYQWEGWEILKEAESILAMKEVVGCEDEGSPPLEEALEHGGDDQGSNDADEDASSE